MLADEMMAFQVVGTLSCHPLICWDEKPEAEVGSVAQSDRASDWAGEGNLKAARGIGSASALALLTFMDEVEPWKTATAEVQRGHRRDALRNWKLMECEEPTQVVLWRSDRELIRVKLGATVSVGFCVASADEGRRAVPASGGAKQRERVEVFLLPNTEQAKAKHSFA